MNILEKGKQHLAREHPFVLYKKPNDNSIFGFFQKNTTLYATESYQTSGFIFAPFDDTFPTYIIPKNESDFISEYIEFKDVKINSTTISNNSTEKKEQHIDLVDKAIQTIVNKELTKVVLARIEEVIVSNFDAFESFEKMISLYKNAMVYLWYHPKEGMWLGATPETLVKMKENTFNTIALASTQTYNGTLEVVWGKKEKEEHQIVVDYISEKLQQSEMSISNFKTTPTHTIKAGNLLHLRADISGTINNLNLKSLLKTLHPTPAVCGLPKEQAKEFILKNELIDRGFYTGFLGEVLLDDLTELFVNLRCMKVKSESVNIYVGGGITRGSNSEKEWKETIAKSNTIKNIL